MNGIYKSIFEKGKGSYKYCPKRRISYSDGSNFYTECIKCERIDFKDCGIYKLIEKRVI